MTVTFPSITAGYAAILALIFVGLSFWVVLGRLNNQALFGDAGNDALQRRIRIQANFAEYVPFALLVIGFYEAAAGSRWFVSVLLFVLLVARLAHPVGMLAAENSPTQYACRGGGIVATFSVMAIAAIALLIRVA